MAEIDEVKDLLAKHKMKKNAVLYPWNPGRSYKDNIQQMSFLSFSTSKPVKTNFQDGYIIPKQTNRIDTELSIIEQRGDFCSRSREDVLNDWQFYCDQQKKSTIYDDTDVIEAACAKEIFTRFPEDRDKIIIPQMLNMYNILAASENPKNRVLLPEIEKDLQAKIQRYFSSEKQNNELMPPTTHSVSSIEDVKEYTMANMDIPKNVVDAKLENVETSMLTEISKDSLRHLTPLASKLVLVTALKHQSHENSNQIITEIAYYDKKRSMVSSR